MASSKNDSLDLSEIRHVERIGVRDQVLTGKAEPAIDSITDLLLEASLHQPEARAAK
jgi:hypothetical protein